MNYVLAHGSWHGGWCWRAVANCLRDAGHHVFTPSFTGMGDRAHLLRNDITIGVFVDDLVQVIQAEELDNVILVGHSFAGVPITGVADCMPERIAHLVYFDSVVLESGKTAFSNYPKADADARIASAAKATDGVAVPVLARIPPVWGLEPGTPEYDWVSRRMTPHPLASYMSPLVLKNPIGNDRPRTYLHCTKPSHPLLEDSRQLVRSLQGWNWIDVPAPHEAHITHPELLSRILLEI